MTKSTSRPIEEGKLPAEYGRPAPPSFGVQELPNCSRRLMAAHPPHAIEIGHPRHELTIALGSLVRSARAAAQSSYSPYSKFRVGAAASVGGKLYTGCNIENSSYGLTMCAERVAIFAAIADGNRQLEAIAVCCIDADPVDSPNTRMPCGACRQVIEEFFADDSLVIIDGVGVFSKNDLLPRPFIFRAEGRGL
jgi:cytidine deaminase